MPKTKPPAINPAWTFSLWLAFQQERNDVVGKLAREVAKDLTWPDWRGLSGLERHRRKQGFSLALMKGVG